MYSCGHAVESCDCMCLVYPDISKVREALAMSPWPCLLSHVVAAMLLVDPAGRAGSKFQLSCAGVLQARPPQQLLGAGVCCFEARLVCFEKKNVEHTPRC